MHLIVGLGNPGEKYESTRHNVGFMVIDNFLKENLINNEKELFNAKYSEYNYKGKKVILIKPMSFMNLSGEVVKKYCDYYKIDVKNVLIINDDLDLEVGSYKLKSNGGSGGHNGLLNIEKNLKTKEYARLKIGISRSKTIPVDKYVLGKLPTSDKDKIFANYDTFDKIIKEFIDSDILSAMNKYN